MQSPPKLGNPKGDWATRNWKWLVPLLCLAVVAGAAGFFALIEGFIRSSDAYTGAVARARSAPAVVDALGTPIKEGFLVTGNVNISGPSGRADLAIPLSGPKGEATVYVAARKSLGAWHFVGLVVEIKGTATRIDLSERKGEADLPTEPAPNPVH